MVKNPPANAGDMSSVSGLGKFLGVGNNQLRYSCLGKSHGQRSLVGYGPWGCKELDATERLTTHTEKGLRRSYNLRHNVLFNE